MAGLALVKLGTLAVKKFNKRITNSLKKEGGHQLLFRQFFVSLGQAHDRVTTRVQRRIYGRITEVAIRPPDEEKAVKTAASLLGEFFMFTAAGAAIVLRLSDSRTKEERLRQELQAIKTELASMMAEKLEYVRHQVELLAQNRAEVAKKKAGLAKKQAELAENQVKLLEKHAEFAEQHVEFVELAKFAELQVEFAEQQAEFEEQQAKFAEQQVEQAEKQEQIVAELAQKQEGLAAICNNFYHS